MIQRIQSVFLLLLALSMLAILVLPIWQETVPQTNQQVELTAFQLTNNAAAQPTSTSSIAIAILAIISAGVALYEIFQFKNRLTQMKLGMLNTLLIAITMGAIIYYSLYVGEDINPAIEGAREPGFYVPVVALLLNALSNRFIRRDEQLVRSVDRLR
jgi:hypothetical protein